MNYSYFDFRQNVFVIPSIKLIEYYYYIMNYSYFDRSMRYNGLLFFIRFIVQRSVVNGGLLPGTDATVEAGDLFLVDQLVEHQPGLWV